MPSTQPAAPQTRSTSTVTAAVVDVLPHVAAVTEAITPAEVAELLRVDVATVRRWITDGALPAYRIGRRLMVPTPALDAFVSQQLVRR